MNEAAKEFRVVRFLSMVPKMRDSWRLLNSKHKMIRGLVEIDAAKPLQFISEQKEKIGEPLSVMSFVLIFMGRAVEANKFVHAYRNWRNQLVIFNDVDVLTNIEIELEGSNFPLTYIVRAVDRKTRSEIHKEIRVVQATANQSANAQRRNKIKWFLLLPSYVRSIFYRAVSLSPQGWTKYPATEHLNALGMKGKGGRF